MGDRAPSLDAFETAITATLSVQNGARAIDFSRVRVMRASVAAPFCEAIRSATIHTAARGLVMDLSSLSRATPPAGFYALGQLRSMSVQRISLSGGNAFMRAFAGAVLTIGRFPDFAFFATPEEAIAWASAQ